MSEQNIKKELETEKKIQDEKIKKDWEEQHGRKMVSRRDFLSAGLITGSSYLTLPPLLAVLAKAEVAQAQDIICSTSSGGELPALITLNLSGGGALPGNWMPLDKAGNKLASYSKLGQGTSPSSTTEFNNNANFYVGSPFLAGLKLGAATQPTSLDVTSFAGVASQTGDDRSTNNFDITGMAYAMGLKGKLLANLGVSNSKTGANITPAFVNPPAPLVVSRYEDVLSALSVAGSLSGLVSKKRALQLFQTIQKLSNYQIGNLLNANQAGKLQQILYCATSDNTALNSSSNNTNTNPLNDAGMARIWGLTNNTQTSTQNYRFATLVFNAMNGNAGSANLVLGGFDYHNGTRTTGDAQDTAAGTIAGQVIASAVSMNKKTLLIVVTDGGISSAESESSGSPWTGDRGAAGSSYMIAIDPSGATIASKSQLGYFNSAQAADDTSVVGASADRAALAFIVNYLSMGKKLGQIDMILPRVLSTAEIEQMTIFG